MLFDKKIRIDYMSDIKNSPITAPLRFAKSYTIKRKYAMEAVKKYRPSDKSEGLLARMVWNEVLYHISYEEYFILNFENLSKKGKKEFIGESEKNRIADRLNNKKYETIFDNKDETYDYFKEFYGRDVVKVTGENDFEPFRDFAEKHTVFVAKPIMAACGFGVAIFETSDYPDTKDMFVSLCRDYRNAFLAEELIVQSEFTKSFHPISVNTVRINTVRTDKEIHIVHPFLRIGKGNSKIDNISSGGIMGLIDVETGIVTTTYDESGTKHVLHPDTGVQVLGTKIPRWNEAVEMVKKMAMVLPENRYTGWDVALTEKGWIMVEANRRAQMVYQYPDGIGCRREFEKYFSEIK